ncbi:MAG: hypothetical protein WC727_03010, partial [Ignavibacteriaceae bacterium]
SSDLFQKKGTSTILIESGGWKDDTEKQFIRKINFIGMLAAFLSIADKTYMEIPASNYESIPMNDEYLFDLLLKNVTVEEKGRSFPIDIAINNDEQKSDSEKGFTTLSTIEDIGDLSGFHGIEEMDCSGLTLKDGKVYPKKIETNNELAAIDFQKLIEDGVLFLPVEKEVLSYNGKSDSQKKFPIRLVEATDFHFQLKIGERPAFYLFKNDTPKFVVLNGTVIRLKR